MQDIGCKVSEAQRDYPPPCRTRVRCLHPTPKYRTGRRRPIPKTSSRARPDTARAPFEPNARGHRSPHVPTSCSPRRSLRGCVEKKGANAPNGRSSHWDRYASFDARKNGIGAGELRRTQSSLRTINGSRLYRLANVRCLRWSCTGIQTMRKCTHSERTKITNETLRQHDGTKPPARSRLHGRERR